MDHQFVIKPVSYFPCSIKCLLIIPRFYWREFPRMRESANMRERRKNFRVEWNSPAKIYDRHSRFARRCIVSNFSNGGAKIAGVEPGTIPNEFILRISPHGRAHRCHVIWRSEGAVGVEFSDNIKETGAQPPSRRPKLVPTD
jgi:hypothetical protein